MGCWINIFGRSVDSITSEEGQRAYYDDRNYALPRYGDSQKLRIKPTQEEAIEYLDLKKKFEDGRGTFHDERYWELNENYDWRTQLIGEEGAYGLVSPIGELILPPIFHDVFSQFNIIDSFVPVIPVSNGKGWGFVTPGEGPRMVVDFQYAAIIPERRDGDIFFVQDKATGKWGAIDFKGVRTSLKRREKIITYFEHRRYVHIILSLRERELMPLIADEIYEDILCTDCHPTTFWMVRIKDKIGILTKGGYSKIIYDTYETNADTCIFRLIRNDRQRARRVHISDPSGKKIFKTYAKT